MELKGILTKGKRLSLTCCKSFDDIEIGDVSLHYKLEHLFNLNSKDFWEDRETQSPQYSVRYVILDKAPEEDKSFNDLSAEVIMNMLYADHVTGCYSEWTCGYGSFNYVLNNGRSIFTELESYIGKYIHFKI